MAYFKICGGCVFGVAATNMLHLFVVAPVILLCFLQLCHIDRLLDANNLMSENIQDGCCPDANDVFDIDTHKIK